MEIKILIWLVGKMAQYYAHHRHNIYFAIRIIRVICFEQTTLPSPYVVLGLFTTRFVAYIGKIQASFIQAYFFYWYKIVCMYGWFSLHIYSDEIYE